MGRWVVGSELSKIDTSFTPRLYVLTKQSNTYPSKSDLGVVVSTAHFDSFIEQRVVTSSDDS